MKHLILKLALAACLAGSVVTVSYAEVMGHPEVPETEAYVSEIDIDWVVVSVNTGHLERSKLNQVLEGIPQFGEVAKVAEFACGLYNRKAVRLNVQSDGDRNFVWQINYLFACAIP